MVKKCIDNEDLFIENENAIKEEIIFHIQALLLLLSRVKGNKARRLKNYLMGLGIQINGFQ